MLGFCPPKNPLVIAGEDCHTNLRGMFFITTNAQSPYAQGKWTDLTQALDAELPSQMLPQQLQLKHHRDPFEQEIDKWGKLEGEFNNELPLFDMTKSSESDWKNKKMDAVKMGTKTTSRPVFKLPKIS